MACLLVKEYLRFDYRTAQETISSTMGYVHTSGQTAMDVVERSLALAGLSTPAERRRTTSSAVAEAAAWMAGAEAYESFLERREESRRGEYMGNAPLRASRAGRSSGGAEVAESA